MSLIHDSLRKLEANQAKHLDTGFKGHESSLPAARNIFAKKLWMVLVAIVGLVLIVYAYLMLSKYQKQNEGLLEDMKQIESKNAQIQYATVKPKQQLPAKVIVQPPAMIVNEPKFSKKIAINPIPQMVDKLVVQKPVVIKTQTKQNKNTGQRLNSHSNNYNKVVDLISQPKKNETINKSVSIIRKKSIKKKQKNKLSVKQTRQLVNNLQLNIESGNQQKVDELLKKLGQSSGKESIVYLRMKAYNSTKNSDAATAIEMYKKILFQKPYDIQAGTNLALIEAKNNQLSQAVKRLKELRKRYPANKSISGYLERLEVN